MCENTDSRCTTTRSRPRCPLSISGLSCFLLPTSLCSRQREVGAAPHRGNANRPLAIQGKANALRTQTKNRRAGKKIKKALSPLYDLSWTPTAPESDPYRDTPREWYTASASD